MTYDEARELMRTRGYDMQWMSASREHMGMIKECQDGTVIFAQVDCKGNNVTLEYMCEPPAPLRVTTGQFALDHPQFDKYESYVAKAAHALCLCGV